jgi:hypothetical protein
MIARGGSRREARSGHLGSAGPQSIVDISSSVGLGGSLCLSRNVGESMFLGRPGVVGSLARVGGRSQLRESGSMSVEVLRTQALFSAKVPNNAQPSLPPKHMDTLDVEIIMEIF